MADNTKPDPTKTYDARFSSNLTAAQIASSTDKRDKLVVASDTEDVTVITKTQKRNIPFDAEANAVNSVNGEVGAVVLDTSHIDSTTDRNYTTDAQQTLLGNTTGTNSGDQDISGIGTNASAITDIEAKTDFITVTQNVDLDTVESDTATNNGKVTNATHTGDVTGDTALTIADNVVTTAKISATGTPSATTFLRGDGSWETADSGGSNATSIQSIPVDTAPVGALAHLKTFIAYWYSNLLLWSEDISQSEWDSVGVTSIDGVDGIIGDTTTGAHYARQSVVLSDLSTYVYCAEFEPVSNDFVGIVTPGNRKFYVDLTSGTVGYTLGVDNHRVTCLDDGWCRVEIEATPVASGSQPVYNYSAINSTSTGFSYTGDGLTVDTRVRKAQFKIGTISDNFPYVKTTTTAISMQQLDWVDKSEITDGDTGYYETADLKAVYVVNGLVSAISLLLDGWMEKSGITNWGSVSSPIITKETDGDTGQVLRIAIDVTGNPSATQICLEVGKTYRITGRGRSDGSAMPRLSTNTGFWSGTSDTEWQYFDETFVAGLTILYLKCISSVSGQYVEFDNMTLKEV